MKKKTNSISLTGRKVTMMVKWGNTTLSSYIDAIIQLSVSSNEKRSFRVQNTDLKL